MVEIVMLVIIVIAVVIIIAIVILSIIVMIIRTLDHEALWIMLLSCLAAITDRVGIGSALPF